MSACFITEKIKKNKERRRMMKKSGMFVFGLTFAFAVVFLGCGGWNDFGDVCSSCDSDADCNPGLTCDSFIGGDVCAYPETEECVYYSSY